MAPGSASAKGSVLVVVASTTAVWVLMRSICLKITNMGVARSAGGRTCDSMMPTSTASIQNERTRDSA